MSSVDRMNRLGLGHLLNQPDEVQREALVQMHAKLEADHELAKAKSRVQNQPANPPKPR